MKITRVLYDGRVDVPATIRYNASRGKVDKKTIERNSKPPYSRAARAKRDARLVNF